MEKTDWSEKCMTCRNGLDVAFILKGMSHLFINYKLNTYYLEAVLFSKVQNQISCLQGNHETMEETYNQIITILHDEFNIGMCTNYYGSTTLYLIVPDGS